MRLTLERVSAPEDVVGLRRGGPESTKDQAREVIRRRGVACEEGLYPHTAQSVIRRWPMPSCRKAACSGNHGAGRGGDRPGPVAIRMIMEIQAGDILRGRYEIQRLLRPAPDKGIYLAHDRVLPCLVIVE